MVRPTAMVRLGRGAGVNEAAGDKVLVEGGRRQPNNSTRVGAPEENTVPVDLGPLHRVALLVFDLHQGEAARRPCRLCVVAWIVGYVDRVGAVGVHHKDFARAGTDASAVGDPGAVRRPGSMIVTAIRGVVGDIMLVAAVGVHHPDVSHIN